MPAGVAVPASVRSFGFANRFAAAQQNLPRQITHLRHYSYLHDSNWMKQSLTGCFNVNQIQMQAQALQNQLKGPDVIRFTYVTYIMFMNLTCFVNYSVTRHAENRRTSEVGPNACSQYGTKNKIRHKNIWGETSL